jgi:hypothetical protein
MRLQCQTHEGLIELHVVDKLAVCNIRCLGCRCAVTHCMLPFLGMEGSCHMLTLSDTGGMKALGLEMSARLRV